ncbi:MAG: mandelate racemase [Dehalococcoidia bacterium]|nr:mandelate racemase [Dehalococcoidia bacterium]
MAARTFAPTRVRLESLRPSVYRIPTDAPESDGTFEWEATTLVLVEARAGGVLGAGYTYADTATATLIHGLLAPRLADHDPMDVPGAWSLMLHAIRNLGRPGICSMAIAAVDAALWDLKARLLGLPLVTLLGAARPSIAVYGSGGFTSYSIERLQAQLGGWAADGIGAVKMKIGRDAAADVARVHAAREAIGTNVTLMVDANGAYTRTQALAQAERFAADGVRWFEEPVSSDDLDGLRLMRDRAPAGMEIAAGEYGYDSWYFRRMLDAGAVDVLQADASRCAGITGFMRAEALCEARSMPLSAHCCPSLHAHVACALPNVRNIEYFHDHARIEHLLFEGALSPVNGSLHPDLSRPGMGLEFRSSDAARYAVDASAM